mgnify:CR=1 FL=1
MADEKGESLDALYGGMQDEQDEALPGAADGGAGEASAEGAPAAGSGAGGAAGTSGRVPSAACGASMEGGAGSDVGMS